LNIGIKVSLLQRLGHYTVDVLQKSQLTIKSHRVWHHPEITHLGILVTERNRISRIDRNLLMVYLRKGKEQCVRFEIFYSNIVAIDDMGIFL
jgi:hypothetical protein